MVLENLVMEISDSQATGRSFCKIISSDISVHDKIMIPQKFVRKYGKHLKVGVYLKAPGHAAWDVDLVQDGNKVCLQNGWPEFARFYSLCFGHFLEFKYQGSSQFDVFIYDKRGTEIEYPLVSTVPHMDEQHNLNFPKFSQWRRRARMDNDELKACKKTRANSACTEACHIGECLMRKLQHQKIAADVTSEEALVGISDTNIQSVEMREPKKHKFHNTQQQGGLVLGGSTNDKGRAKALALAKVSKSKNPSFILTVLPSYLNRRSPVDIRKPFAKRYMRGQQNFKVLLQVKGKTWPVTCLASLDRYRFGGGWLQFAQGNSLSLGDVCVFELVDHAQLLLNVFIYRAAKC